MAMPDFGIDPALLAGVTPQPQPMDPLAAAIAALQASGAQVGPPVPSLYGTGAQDTDLEPLPPRERFMDMEPVQPTAQYDASGRQIHGHLLPEGSVTVTSQQPMPSKAEAAARHRAEDIADPDVTLAPGDVVGQSARETMALNAAGDAKAREAQYTVQAQAAQAERIAQAHERAANEQAQLDQFYQQGRAAAEAKADMDTNAWLQEFQLKAQQEPNTHRWFEAQPAVAKCLWALSMVFGSASAALTPGARNVALDMVRQNMQQDTELQKERLARELDALKAKGQVIDRRNLRNITDLTDDHTMALGRLQALKQAYLQRAMAPGALDLQAGLAGADAWFAEQELKIAGSRRQDAVQLEESRLQRQFQAGQNALNRSLQERLHAAEIAKDYDLAQFQAGVKAASEAAARQAEAHKDEVRISPTAGAKLVDAKTGQPVGDPGDEGALWINEKMKPDDVQKIITAASSEQADLEQLYKALKDDASFMGILTGTDVSYQQALARLQQSRVAGQGGLGHTTDRDMDVVVKGMTGTGNDKFGRAALLANRSKVVEALREVIDKHKKEVDLKLAPYAKPGTRIDWSPKDLSAPEAKPLTPDEQIADLGGTPKAPAPITNPQQLREARARGVDPRLTESSAAGEYAPVLQKLTASMEGSSPAHIRELAEAALSAVTPRQPDPWDTTGERALGGGKPNRGDSFAKDAYIPEAIEAPLKDAEAREKALIKDLASTAIGRGFKADLGAKLPFGNASERWKAHKPELPSREEIQQRAATEYHFTNLSADDIDHLAAEVEKRIKATVGK